MQFRFLHAGDIHLGYMQYNQPRRADDFAKAYYALVEHALDTRPDAVLIAGDLFHHSQPDAWTMKQAMGGLADLRAAGIPVVAVEGNHDTTYAAKNISWMTFLCHQGYLTLLNATRRNDLYSLTPFDETEGVGSYIDIGSARIYGVKYMGATLARVLEQVRDDIEPAAYTVLMLHAGMEGQIPHLHGGLTPGQIGPLHERGVDYLALGHIHKRLIWPEVNPWVFNPGSTEINSFEEMSWAHGFFDISIDTDRDPPQVVTYIDTRPRAFRRINVTADGEESLEEYIAAAHERIREAVGIPPGAVVELHLGGVAAFRRQDLPLEELKTAVETQLSPLVARVRNSLTPKGVVPVRHGERLSRAELERQVIERMIYDNPEYRDVAGAWASLILEVKGMALEGDLAPNIAQHIQTFLHRQDDTAALPTAEAAGIEGE